MFGLVSLQRAGVRRMGYSVKCSIWIDAPRERVWQTLTDAARLEECLCEYREFTALKPGAILKFGPEDDAVFAIIAVLDTPGELVLHHPPQPQYYPVAIDTRYLLVEDGGGTCLTIIETGYDALSDTIRSQRIDSANEGYTWALAKLKDYLERAA